MSSRRHATRRGAEAGRKTQPTGVAPTQTSLPASAPSGERRTGVGSSAHVDDVAEAVALVVSHRVESGPPAGPPYAMTIRLTGRRRGVEGLPGKSDAFTTTETIAGVVPGSGALSTTSWIYGITAGEWHVKAEVVGPERARAANPAVLQRVGWSWRRWSMVPSAAPAKTRWAVTAPLAAAPGVLTGSFILAATVALVGAMLVQPAFLTHHGVPVAPAVGVSLLATALGVAGAKAWYMLLKGPSLATLREGWSVDGFLVTAPLVAIATAALLGLPVGGYLDAIAPAIFLAVAVGRIGCFLTGCCAGRITTGRGVWSSDRRVGARRIPAQLIESAIGMALSAVASALVLSRVAVGSGLVFLLAIMAYAAARQGLLRLRAETRQYSWRRASPRAAA